MTQQDNNRYYNNYDQETTLPADLAYEIDESVTGECDNLKSGTGTSGQDENNCPVLTDDLVEAIRQVYYAIKTGDIVISANEDSKCDGSTLPTLASILSRLLRFDEAVACILCTYDPILIDILRSGEFPQILMGQSNSKYPVWRNPSTTPTEGSQLPITSGGVYAAIKDAQLSLFHSATDDEAWVESGGRVSYDYCASSLADLRSQVSSPENGETALLSPDPSRPDEPCANASYQYDSELSEWVLAYHLDGPSDYAVVQILKGTFKDNELYWLSGKNGTKCGWNLMDASIAAIQEKINEINGKLDKAVYGADTPTFSGPYALAVGRNYSDLIFLDPPEGKTLITLAVSN